MTLPGFTAQNSLGGTQTHFFLFTRYGLLSSLIKATTYVSRAVTPNVFWCYDRRRGWHPCEPGIEP